MTAATGAWAQNSTTYNVTFGGFGNSYMNITSKSLRFFLPIPSIFRTFISANGTFAT